MTSIYEQFRQPGDLSAKHGQLLVLDLLYLLWRRRISTGRVPSWRPHAVSSTVAHVAHRQGRRSLIQFDLGPAHRATETA